MASDISIAIIPPFITTLVVDTIFHPVDTLITRIQSPNFSTHYKSATGSLNRLLYRNLYRGFGPTLIAGLPASAGFWVVYEKLKAAGEQAKAEGYLRNVPLPVVHTASSAVGELVSCAVMNPAEVLKQNAQVQNGAPGSTGNLTVAMLKKFIIKPTKLWTGYSVMAASYIPSVSLTMALYESIKEWLRARRTSERLQSIPAQAGIASLSGAIASGCVSCLMVPLDVIKTRMRLLAGSQIPYSPSSSTFSFSARGVAAVQGRGWEALSKISVFSVTKETLRVEGIRGLFRGLGLTAVSMTAGSAVYFAIYEGIKLYLKALPGGTVSVNV